MPIDWLVLFGAFASGLLGTVHCVAMCGGIATRLSRGKQGHRVDGGAAQPRRVLGYALGGAIVGGFGGGPLALARDPGVGIAMRAAVGIVLVVAGLRLLDRGGRLPRFAGGPRRALWHWLAPLRAKVWPADTAPKTPGAGHALGLDALRPVHHPAGGGMAAGQRRHGALTMAAFGIGTLPVMVPLTWAGCASAATCSAVACAWPPARW